MPPFKLPDERSRSGYKTNTVHRDSATHFSGIGFEDRKHHEHLHIHSQKDMTVHAENNQLVNIGSHQHTNVGNMHVLTVGGLPIPPSGSGSGAGGPTANPSHASDSSDTDGKNSHQSYTEERSGAGGGSDYYNSPFDWQMGNDAIVPGVKLQYVFGAKFDAEIGTKVDSVIGPRVDLTINPFGHAGLIQWFPGSGVITGGLATALGGKTDFVYGQDTKMVYGPSVKFAHGPQVTINSSKDPTNDVSMSFRTKILLALPPLLAGAGAFVFGGTDAFERFPDLPIVTNVAEELTLGLLAASEIYDERKRQKKKIEVAWAVFEDVTDRVWETLKGDLDPDEEIDRDMLEAAYWADPTVVEAVGVKDKAVKDATKKLPVLNGMYGYKESLKVVGGTLASPVGAVQGWWERRSGEGAGSGSGGQGMDLSHQATFTEGCHFVAASHVQLLGLSQDPTVQGPNTVYVSAGGETKEGYVMVNGSQAVTLTAGPNSLILLNNMEKGLIVADPGPAGTIRLQRGPKPDDQVIEMTPLAVTIQSPQIVLKAGAGLSSIQMDAQGITIEGLNIKQMARVQFELQTMVQKIQSQLSDVTAAMQKIT
jgi:hypothetical protein